MPFRFRVVAGAQHLNGTLHVKNDLVESSLPLDTMFPGVYVKESVVERVVVAGRPAPAPAPTPVAPPTKEPAFEAESDAGGAETADVTEEFPLAADKGLRVTHDGEGYAVLSGDTPLAEGLTKTATKKLIKDFDPDEE